MFPRRFVKFHRARKGLINILHDIRLIVENGGAVEIKQLMLLPSVIRPASN